MENVATMGVTSDKRRMEPVLVASLAAVYLIWSSTYLAMRVAVAELPPLLMASVRFLAAGTVMFALARRAGAKWPGWRRALRIAGPGIPLFVGGNGLVAIAETSVSSGGAAVVCATMPLWVGVFSAFLGERPSAREWLALALGFAGVLVLIGSPSLDSDPLHVGVLLASPPLWALGSMWARRAPKPSDGAATRGDALLTPALQMLLGGVTLIAGGLVTGETFPASASTSAWLCVAYLGVFGSIIGFTAYAWLLRNARPVVATSYAFVNPVLAVLIGAALYGEPLAWTTAVANALIVAAVVLALRKR
jgi:drug/metabolite transporter (DMT)-like permease|nr:drug/metabolite exporter YedA [Kofleriaceae bacterium]